MRKLEDGWYPLGDKGPMVSHVPGYMTDTVRDERMQAFVPRERPETPLAARPEETSRWRTHDGGQCYVHIHEGKPVAVRFVGTGQLRVARVKQLAECFAHVWLDAATDENADAMVRSEVDVPVTLSAEQPTHLFAWITKRGGIAHGIATPMRVHQGKAYAHMEWRGRDNPKVNPNWIVRDGQWRSVGPTGDLQDTPAGAAGQLRVAVL